MKNERNAGRKKVTDGTKLIITVPKFNKEKIIKLTQLKRYSIINYTFFLLWTITQH
jgi:hypothetical protein